MRCISDQKITPQNSDDESLQRCTEDGGGREGGLLPPTPSLVQSLGPQRLSWLRLFLLFSCLGFWLSYSLRCLSSLNLFFPLFLPHPLFIPPYPVLGLSHGVNLWLWSSRNIGMATHALLCFVSLLACWLAHILSRCVHVYVQYRIYAASFFFEPNYLVVVNTGSFQVHIVGTDAFKDKRHLLCFSIAIQWAWTKTQYIYQIPLNAHIISYLFTCICKQMYNKYKTDEWEKTNTNYQLPILIF